MIRSDIQPTLLRQLNERRVLETIRRHGPVSRAEVTRLSGISAPTVSKVVASLMGSGFLEEEDLERPVVGRPHKRLRLASQNACILGAVIDVGHCFIAPAGLNGKLDDDRIVSFPTPQRYSELLSAFARRARVFTDESTRILGLGISVPGLVNHREQRCEYAANLPMLNGRALAQDIGHRVGLETVILQKTEALCLAERFVGRAEGMDDFTLLDITAGMSLGIVSGGQLLRGHSGLGGELGHMTVVPEGGRLCSCGNHGCLQMYASDTALMAAVSKHHGRKIDIETVVRLVREEKLNLDREFEEMVTYLAIGVAMIVNVLNPASLIIHGRCFDAKPSLFQRLVELTATRALEPAMADCEIVRAEGGKLQGAVAGILNHLMTNLGPTLS